MALGPGRRMAKLALLAAFALLVASQLPTSHGEPGASSPQAGGSKDAQQWTGPLSLEWDQAPSQTVERGPVSFAFSALDAFGLPCGDCVYNCYVRPCLGPGKLSGLPADGSSGRSLLRGPRGAPVPRLLCGGKIASSPRLRRARAGFRKLTSDRLCLSADVRSLWLRRSLMGSGRTATRAARSSTPQCSASTRSPPRPTRALLAPPPRRGRSQSVSRLGEALTTRTSWHRNGTLKLAPVGKVSRLACRDVQ